MPFASIHFIFLFLPVVILLYYIIPNRHWKAIIISIASLVFFGWEDPTHIPLIFISILFNYFTGRFICAQIEKNEPYSARINMWIAVVINILILAFYKYLGFFGETVLAVMKIDLNIPAHSLPLGISYFTFSGISYILDIYNSVEKADKNIFRFTSYLTMFPKLLQGPITRFGQVKNEFADPHFNVEEVMQGVRRFIMGLAKKVLIADSLAIAANKVFDGNLANIGAGVAWFGLIAYTLQIYFDFAGYTDMAVGLGKIFGFKLPENFNFPYISRSITDFWRRWHMTLTAWFRTYVFIPLEFARKKQTFLRQQTNILIVFALTGLWHGASWSFVIWGAYFGLILAIEASGFGKKLKKIPAFLQHFYSITLVMLGWIFFRLTEIKEWLPFFKALAGGNGWTGFDSLRTLRILFYAPVLILGIFFCTPLLNKLERRIQLKFGWSRMILDVIYIGVFILVVCYILSNGFSSLLYAQF